MRFFEICAEILVPKFTRAEVWLPGDEVNIKCRSSLLGSDNGAGVTRDEHRIGVTNHPVFGDKSNGHQYLKVSNNDFWK